MTDMQELASHTLPLRGSHLIEASAGTGKTYNIVRIYLRLLLERELSVGDILVMTFTVAATAELRNRLGDFLREALLHWHDSADACIADLRGKVPSERAKLLLSKALVQLDEASIYTIHGFCKRALSQQAFFTGISFHADMGADTTELKLLAAEDWYRNKQTQPDYDQLYDKWPTPESFVAHWGRVIDSPDEATVPTLINTDDLLAEFRLHWSAESEAFTALNKIGSRTAEKTAAAIHSVSTQLQAVADGLLQLADLNIGTEEVSKCYSTEKKQAQMPHSHALLQAVLHNQRSQSLILACTGIDYIRHHIRNDKERLDQLDFNDLISQLNNALQGEHRDALRLALAEQFPAALVDEFQDTDPEQYAILNAIYQDRPDCFVCLIGDPKQAIYGFRGGDVFAYLHAREQVNHQWTMNTNYRSCKNLIDGYNQIFLGDLTATQNSTTFGFGIDYRKVMPPKDAQAKQWRDSEPRTAVQWVDIQPVEVPSRGLNKSFQHTIARWCCSEIVRLIKDVECEQKAIKPGNIALLVRGYSEAELLQTHLREAGLASVYLSNRSNILHSSEAADLQQLLQGIWQFENDRLFVAALASHWLGMSTTELAQLQQDEHLWAQWQLRFEQWRQDWQHRGLMSMLLAILQAHFRPPNEQLDRTLTNMLHLAELLQKESNRHRQPDALLHWFAQARLDESGRDENQLRLESDDELIKIVTMHGSKGLEYPIVFLPFIAYQSKVQKAPPVYRYHDRKTHRAKLAFAPSDEEIAMHYEEEQAERVRLFYVAATRAASRLYCCLAPFSSFKDSALAQTIKQTKYDIDSLTSQLQVPECASIISVNESSIGSASWQQDDTAPQVMAAQFSGHIERDWWLSSFSALTRHVGHSAQSTPDRDDQEAIELLPAEQPLRFRLAKGAEAGNLLHDALEHCDFTDPDFPALFQQADERYSSLSKTFTQHEFEEWLQAILSAPLQRGHTLGTLSKSATLRESEFYFPMQGTDVKQLASLVSDHRGQEFSLPDRHKLKGMMHGFIDLIFEADGQYFVADYKSTYLGNRLQDYSNERMRHSIEHSNYDVQYLIYSLALHRYLKVRLTGYDPQQHFGGVYYFYLRGMNAEGEQGVYHREITPQLLEQLDTIFANTNSVEASI